MSGFNFPSNEDLGLPDDIYGSGGYYAKDDYSPDLEDKPEDTFLNRFMKEMEEGGYFKQSKDQSSRYDIYGDRRRSGGDTVTDLGGGNTLSAPDSAAAVQAQMMALGQKSTGQKLGGGIGAAAGAALGGPFAPVTSVLGRFAGDFIGGLF